MYVKKKQAASSEESFSVLMLAAAEFASSRGGIEPAKQSLTDASKFIDQAGSVSEASRALDILESLKATISNPPASPAIPPAT